MTEIFIPDAIWYEKNGAENRRQKMDSIYGAGFWIMSHSYKRGNKPETIVKHFRNIELKSLERSTLDITILPTIYR